MKWFGWLAAVLVLGVATLPVNPSFWTLSARAQIVPPPEPCHAVAWSSCKLAEGMITFYFIGKNINEIGELCFTKLVLYHMEPIGRGVWKKTPITTNNVAGIAGSGEWPWFQFPLNTNNDAFYGVEITALTNAVGEVRLVGAGPIRVRLIQ